MTDDRFERLQRLAEQYAIERDAFEAKDRKINELHARIAELELAAKWEGDLAQQALDDLKKRDARIAELEHTSKCHVEGFVKQCEIANKQAHRIEELEAENTKLRAALKPFDEMLQRDFSIMADDKRYADDFTSTVLMRLGDLRAARAALEKKND